MAISSIEWGTLNIILDNLKFEQAYQRGREHYFGSGDERMTIEQVMQLIVVPNGKGGYQFDGEEAEDLLGFALGFLGGPWMPETDEEQQERERCTCATLNHSPLRQCKRRRRVTGIGNLYAYPFHGKEADLENDNLGV